MGYMGNEEGMKFRSDCFKKLCIPLAIIAIAVITVVTIDYLR